MKSFKEFLAESQAIRDREWSDAAFLAIRNDQKIRRRFIAPAVKKFQKDIQQGGFNPRLLAIEAEKIINEALKEYRSSPTALRGKVSLKPSRGAMKLLVKKVSDLIEKEARKK